MSVGTEGSGPNPRTYSRAEYAALEAENARLREERDSFQRVGIQAAEERDAALAQLAAIQGGMGEVPAASKYRIGVNGEWLYSSDREYLQRERDEYESQCEPGDCEHETPEPIYSLADVQRITAAMAAEVVELKESMAYRTSLVGRLEKERDALRAELAEVKGRGAVATIEQREPYENGSPNPCKTLRWAGNNAEDDFPAGTKLYASPPASPDVEGLKNAARYEWLRDHYHGFEHYRKSTGTVANLDREIDEQIAALSTWRQVQESK